MTTGFTLEGASFSLAPARILDTGMQIGWDLLDGEGKRITTFTTDGARMMEAVDALRRGVDFVATTLVELTERQIQVEKARILLGVEAAAPLEDLPLEKLAAVVASLEKSAAAKAPIAAE